MDKQGELTDHWLTST